MASRYRIRCLRACANPQNTPRDLAPHYPAQLFQKEFFAVLYSRVPDDVLATGGTRIAAAKLINQVGALAIASICLLEIESLGGKAKLGSNGLVSHAVLKTA